MISKLAKNIAHFFVVQNITQESKEVIYAYGMELLISDVLNTIIVLLIALISHSSGLVIDSYYHWLPDEDQWWITGFVPNIYDYGVKENELIQIASVDLSSFYDYSSHQNKVFEDLRDMYEDDVRYNDNLIFDNKNQLIWLVW